MHRVIIAAPPELVLLVAMIVIPSVWAFCLGVCIGPRLNRYVIVAIIGATIIAILFLLSWLPTQIPLPDPTPTPLVTRTCPATGTAAPTATERPTQTAWPTHTLPATETLTPTVTKTATPTATATLAPCRPCVLGVTNCGPNYTCYQCPVIGWTCVSLDHMLADCSQCWLQAEGK